MPASMSGNGQLEVIVPDYNTSIRWIEHGYPCNLTKWHYHPEVEFHLIRKSTGYMMVGDGLIPFEPGQFTLIGSNVPHHWISNIDADEVLDERDVACQIHPNKLASLVRLFPEAAPIHTVLERSRHGILLKGGSAARAAELLESAKDHSPYQRLIDVLSLLQVFALAPDDEWETIVTPSFAPDTGSDVSERINTTLAYINANLGGDISLDDIADRVAMNPAAFSRFFHQTTGINFSDLVSRLRISHACKLLVTTSQPISRIRTACGYRNASNFNRRFLEEIGMTPSAYRGSYGK
ncbi:helix-turn-helix domain-containing protein [Bifidobacterium sp. SMB2]|uniref:Helix-turn-helix domain-containing protein n=1 Tax=Bifidobacterium saimiriisciurei TaxID=2661627 RepID=A0ABX0C7N7_9BIFI|nr:MULTISPECIES: helix-turn-helix domain-containing protein [Bifidobacterium]NEG95747.1 helix-turn-helix domain-containing protein [Bifidobacterium sp. SMB2]NEH11174.1 helix-turn-helix domain-containing protein [Bifidobacterium saimiriisciurei]